MSDEYQCLTPEQYEKTREKYREHPHFDLVEADDHTVLLDLDDGQQPRRRIRKLVKDLFGLELEQEWVSKSGNGMHQVWLTHE